ncbi:hypothetical protein OZX68_05815 [Streptococcaceae bacterium ESL0729]|nr:hypothetical protein OZX68_05815 [Streptococcaceae bacterium ESL0729]
MAIWMSKYYLPDYEEGQDKYIKSEQASKIASRLGFQDLLYYSYDGRDKSDQELNADLEKLVEQVQDGDLVFVQYPLFQDDDRYSTEYIRHLRAKKIILIALVWDIPAWSFNDQITNQDDYIQDNLKFFDCLIVENATMKERIRSLSGYRDKDILSLDLTDFLLDQKAREVMKSDNIYFLSDMDYQPLPFLTTQFEKVSDLVLQGSLAGYGLVKNNFFNNSLDLAVYLALGIPPLVSSENVQARFIQENKLGLVYQDINALPDLIKQVSVEDYDTYKKNISKYSELTKLGFFMEKTLLQALDNSFLKEN